MNPGNLCHICFQSTPNVSDSSSVTSDGSHVISTQGVTNSILENPILHYGAQKRPNTEPQGIPEALDDTVWQQIQF